MDSPALLHELEPVAASLLDRHLASAKEWFPHDLVPWSRGRDFDGGYEWDPNEVDLAPAVRSSLFVNLLTEDNLPYYFRTIGRCSGATARGAHGCAAGPQRKGGTRS
jgi:acyl-[acyl-carrier-protein] desaturase